MNKFVLSSLYSQEYKSLIRIKGIAKPKVEQQKKQNWANIFCLIFQSFFIKQFTKLLNITWSIMVLFRPLFFNSSLYLSYFRQLLEFSFYIWANLKIIGVPIQNYKCDVIVCIEIQCRLHEVRFSFKWQKHPLTFSLIFRRPLSSCTVCFFVYSLCLSASKDTIWSRSQPIFSELNSIFLVEIFLYCDTASVASIIIQKISDALGFSV